MSPKLHSLPSVLLVCYFKNKKALECSVQGLFGGGDEGSFKRCILQYVCEIKSVKTPLFSLFLLRISICCFPVFSSDFNLFGHNSGIKSYGV